MLSYSSSSDPIDQWLHSNKSSQKKYFINQIPLGLLCDSATDFLDPSENSNNVIGQVILPNSSWGCRLCQLSFPSIQEHQEHYKSLDHLLNLKNHLKNEENGESNAAAANEEEEEGEDVSESSSDEDNEIPQGAAAAAVVAESSEGSVRKVYSNQTGTQYIFHPTESLWEYRVSDMIFGFPRGISSLEHLVTSPSPSSAASSSYVNHWTILSQTISYFHEKSHLICILILRSGKFAASIFDTSTGKSMIHKVFRRYTVRAKAGGSQSSHDSKGRKAQSIGSQLRRYGEQALREDIYKLLLSWKDFINNSSAIFLSLPKTMRSYIFHNDLPQDRDYPLKTTADSRIKFLSFPVKNPIYEELCAVYEKCMTIHFTQFTSLDDPTAPTPGDAIAGGDRKVDHRAIQDSNSMHSSAPRPPNEAEVGLQQYSVAEELIQLQRACESSDIREVNSLLSELRTSMNEDHVNDPVSIESLATLLHIVAQKGDAKLVTLLLEFGASPEVKDIRSRTPYHLCKDKDTRDAFRRFRGTSENLWDWDGCGVPPGLTDEMIRIQKEKEKEKKKRAKQRKKEEQKVQQLEKESKLGGETNGEAEGSEEKYQEEFSVFERRAREAAGVCPSCQLSLYGIPTYEIFDQKCCSSACVMKLRRKLAAEAAEKRMASK